MAFRKSVGGPPPASTGKIPVPSLPASVGSTYRKGLGLAWYRKRLSRKRCPSKHIRLGLKKNEKTSSLITYSFQCDLGHKIWDPVQENFVSSLLWSSQGICGLNASEGHSKCWSSDPHLQMGVTSSQGCCRELHSKAVIRDRKPRRVSKPFLPKISSSGSKARHLLSMYMAPIHKALYLICLKRINSPCSKKYPPKKRVFLLLPSRAASKNPVAPSFYPT